jgi:uncharacterized membrane protein
MSHAADYFSEEQQLQIKNAVQQAESLTSGEIRVCIDSKIKGDAYARAVEFFHQLKMHETDLHNGVLIYVAIENKQFAVIGDSGIHQHVQQSFWDNLKDEMIPFFKNGDYTGGLLHAIAQAGNALVKHFPHKQDDKNELSDDIIFGKNE